MIYVNDKPVIIVCDNVPFVKKIDCIKDMMQNAESGFPYNGAKEHYVLDIDNPDFCKMVVTLAPISNKPSISIPFTCSFNDHISQNTCFPVLPDPPVLSTGVALPVM